MLILRCNISGINYEDYEDYNYNYSEYDESEESTSTEATHASELHSTTDDIPTYTSTSTDATPFGI